MTEDTDTDKEDEYFVFLNFKGRVPKEILHEMVFLKVANLHSKNPLIQVNDLLFKGTQDFAIGSNIFYIHQKNNVLSPAFPFEKQYPTELKLVMTEKNVINCEQVKLKPKKAVLPEGSDTMKFNLNWSYDEILKKFEEGSLDMKDIIYNEKLSPDTDKFKINENTERINVERIGGKSLNEEQVKDNSIKLEPMELEQDIVNTSEIINSSLISDKDMAGLENIPEVQNLEQGYNKLLELAKKPMRTRKIEGNSIVPCEEQFRMSYNYRNIECKILQPPAFRVNNKVDLTEENLWNFIDLARCKLFGLLESPDDFPRSLTETEKRKLLILENIDLLSLQARYIVIQTQIEKLKNIIQTIGVAERTKSDEFGYTPENTLCIYKKLEISLANKLRDIQKSESDRWLKNVSKSITQNLNHTNNK